MLFKYLQGVAHLWDMHELALIKQERSLQELLQDTRREHDTENQVCAVMAQLDKLAQQYRLSI
jgi:hypothetical protein